MEADYKFISNAEMFTVSRGTGYFYSIGLIYWYIVDQGPWTDPGFLKENASNCDAQQAQKQTLVFFVKLP